MIGKILEFVKKHWVAVGAVVVVLIAVSAWGISNLVTKAKAAAANLVGATWWQNLFGKVAPGTQIPDYTGSVGAAVATASYNAVVNDHSQGFYNAALQQYAYDNGFDTSLSAQGSAGWSWTSYNAWGAAGYPALPSASSVTVDSNGVYHNDYV